VYKHGDVLYDGTTNRYEGEIMNTLLALLDRAGYTYTTEMFGIVVKVPNSEDEIVIDDEDFLWYVSYYTGGHNGQGPSDDAGDAVLFPEVPGAIRMLIERNR
jgi:hypothetical protein